MTPTYHKYKRLRDIGMSGKEIAAACGVKRNTVYKCLCLGSDPAKFAAERLRGKARAERLRRELGMRPNAGHRVAWADQAADLRQSGLSSSEIARQLGVTRNAVVGALWRRGIVR